MSLAVARRTTPLLLILVVGAIVVLVRLFNVQVVEHEVWAEEAARLVHAGKELPYERGRILDTKGRVLARDKETFHLVLTYRDFRRGHPLGQVAHARSLLEGRPVSLMEARENLFEWADELVRLTPRQVAAFGRGEGLETPSLRLPAFPEEQRRERARAQGLAGRAKDLGFYLRRLIPMSSVEYRRLEKLAREEVRRGEGVGNSYLELASRVLPGRPAPGALRILVERRILRALERLAGMAELLEWDARGRFIVSPLAELILELEDTRRWVEDATAAKLFAEATGFAPGRIDHATLVTRIDLSWIARELGWDEARLFEWARTTRNGWEGSWRDTYALPRLIADLRLDPAFRPEPDDYLARVYALFLPGDELERALDGSPPDWTDRDAQRELVVLSSLEELFDGPGDEARAAVGANVLPIDRDEVHALHATLRERWDKDRATLQERFERAARLTDPARREEQEAMVRRTERQLRTRYWGLVDAAWSFDGLDGFRMPEEIGAPEDKPGAKLRELFDSRLWSAPDDLLYLTRALVESWDRGLQQAIRDELDARIEASEPDRLVDGRLVIREELRSRAAERADYFLKDFGRRLKPLVKGEPSYEVLYLIARYGEDFRGFQAREAREREYPTLPGDTTRAAPGLIGNVIAVGVEDVVSQRRQSERLRALKAIPDKTDEQRLELERLVGRVLRTDEVKGVAGVEGYWNRELTGRNGYRESRGLEDVYGKGRADTVSTPRIDGLDVTLTLDTDLQRAAQRTLKSKAGLEDETPDHGWYREPVGAAVLVTIDGDVLAAASEPDGDSPVPLEAKLQRTLKIERTLTIPSFQPPGSVFKPFVAAYAQAHMRADWELAPCKPSETGAKYVDVHCHRYWGHGLEEEEYAIDMHRALVVSCNSYFAFLGEQLQDEELRRAAALFGFGQPTGLKIAPPGDDGIRRRVGLVEHAGGMRDRARYGLLGDHDRRLAGNGLGVLEVTPLQLARGMIGLATGRLQDLRLVRRVGARDLPVGESRAIDLDEEALAFVREALADVVNSTDAQRTGKVLSRTHLGFDVAAKTGSADLASEKRLFYDKYRVPKHTWVAGWAPAEDPQVVFVVFVHDTMATSSHGAVYLARELLLQPEVLSYLATRGVDVSGVPAR